MWNTFLSLSENLSILLTLLGKHKLPKTLRNSNLEVLLNTNSYEDNQFNTEFGILLIKK